MGLYSDALQKALDDGHIDHGDVKRTGFANGRAAAPVSPSGTGLSNSHLSAAFAEQIMTLQERIEYLQGKKQTRMIAVCGCVGDEGSSTIAQQLAIAYAQAGVQMSSVHKNGRHAYRYSGNKAHNTLVIDANLHTPRLHQLFGRALEQGLTEYVMTGVELEHCTKWLPIRDFALISAGSGARTVSDIFKSQRFAGLLKRAAASFSTVIFDCPAIVVHPDVLAMLTHLDGIVLVARAYRTPMDKLQRAREIIESRKGRIFGVVLNRSRFA